MTSAKTQQRKNHTHLGWVCQLYAAHACYTKNHKEKTIDLPKQPNQQLTCLLKKIQKVTKSQEQTS